MSSTLPTIKVNLEIENTDVFKDICNLLSDLTKDPRVEENVKQEYKGKLIKIIDTYGNVI